jgi:hypothetical protein
VSVNLRAKGLFTNPNLLSEVPEGALVKADNVIIDRDGVIENRRGFKKYATLPIGSDRAKQLLQYKDRILTHYGTTLAFDNGSGTLTSFSGSYAEPDSTIRMKAVEANSNLYFTTSTGIKKVSATSASAFTGAAGFIASAGAPKALDLGVIINYDTSGFFAAESKVAYRLLWGIKDANNNLILGYPSERAVITNISTAQSATNNITAVIPADINTSNYENYFYQLYRTAVLPKGAAPSLDDIDPGDEMNQVYEGSLTLTEITNGIINPINDITPEDFRANGAPLYTNQISGEGILQANEQPPLAKDLTLFRGSVFYANTKTKNKLQFTLLGVGGFTSSTSQFKITDGTTINTYTFVGQAEVTDVTCLTKASTTDGSFFLLNSAGNERKYFIWFDKTGSTATPTSAQTVGRIGIKVDISSAVTAAQVATALQVAISPQYDFDATVLTSVVTITNVKNGKTIDAIDSTDVPTGYTITVTTQGDGEDTTLNQVLLSSNPSTGQQIEETAKSLGSVLNRDPLSLGYAYYVSGPTDLPGLINLEARSIEDPAFSLSVNLAPMSSNFSPNLPTSTLDRSVISDNETLGNRLYYSKFQQPEAVPIVNYIDIGPRDKAILRVAALRDSLFVFKEDALYRVSGVQAPDFNVTLFDASTLISSADSLCILNNQIYAATSQGIITCTDTGVSIISRPIEDQYLKFSSYDNFDAASFGLGYEADRSYLLYTVTNSADTVATQVFRYNTVTQAWTRWIRRDRCGIINSKDNKIYVGESDNNTIEQERKSFSRLDYADREFSVSIPANSISGTTIILSSITNATVGDVLQQVQKLTIYRFNSLLSRLDLDFNVSDSDYLTTLKAIAGDYLDDKVLSLCNKLDLDPGVAQIDFYSTTIAITNADPFTQQQLRYNNVVNKLNTDSSVYFNDYTLSTGTINFEARIVTVDQNTNSITNH